MTKYDMIIRVFKSVKKHFLGLYNHFASDAMKRNSLFLIAGQLINAGSMLLFWIICARLYSTHDIGLATGFISYAVLAATFTTFGLPITVVRFLPKVKDKSGFFGATLLTVIVASLLGSLVAVVFIKIITPELSFVQASPILILLLIILVMGNALSALLDNMLMAYQKGQYILIKHCINSLPRLVLPFLFTAMALKGIISVPAALFVCSTIYSCLIIRYKLLQRNMKPNFESIIENKNFAIRNYLGGLAGILPSTLVPIIILNNLGSVMAAYFYMPLQMAAFLSVISGSVSQAFMSEVSQEDDEAKYAEHLKKAVAHLFRLLIPAILILCTLGWPILFFYGKPYVDNGYIALVILAMAGLFVGMNWIGDTWLLVTKKMNAYMLMNFMNSIFVVVGVLIASRYGLIQAAFGWLGAQFLSALVYVIIFMKPQLRQLFVSKSS